MFRIEAHWRGDVVYVDQRTGLDWKVRTTLHDNPANTTALSERAAARVVARLVNDNADADPWDALTHIRAVPANGEPR